MNLALLQVWFDCNRLLNRTLAAVRTTLQGAFQEAAAHAPSLLVLDDLHTIAPCPADGPNAGGPADVQAWAIAEVIDDLIAAQQVEAQEAWGRALHARDVLFSELTRGGARVRCGERWDTYRICCCCGVAAGDPAGREAARCVGDLTADVIVSASVCVVATATTAGSVQGSLLRDAPGLLKHTVDLSRRSLSDTADLIRVRLSRFGRRCRADIVRPPRTLSASSPDTHARAGPTGGPL